MSLQLELLDNNSFSQELENDFQKDEILNFDQRGAIRNSRRRKSKAVTRGKARVRKAQARVRKAQTALRKLKRQIR